MSFHRYTLTDIGTLADLPYSHATAINTLPDRTQVIGWSALDNGDLSSTAFLWEKPDNAQPEPLFDIRDYSPPQILTSKALGLNSIFPSTVVGWWSLDGFTPQPMIWTVTGSQSIPTFSGGVSQVGEARSVNNDNVIVGYAYTALGRRHGFVQLPTGGMLDLPPRPGVQGQSEAYYINNNGLVAGWTQLAVPIGQPPVDTKKACVWLLGQNYVNAASAQIEEVATDPTAADSIGYSVNATGYIAGRIRNPDGYTFSSLWQEGFGWIFGAADSPGNSPSFAYAINDQNFIVGTTSAGPSGPMHAFISFYRSLTDRDTADLNTLVDNIGGWTLTTATGINNRGQIVGDGIHPNGNVRAWLLTPSS